jgi:hypothetical protein
VWPGRVVEEWRRRQSAARVRRRCSGDEDSGSTGGCQCVRSAIDGLKTGRRGNRRISGAVWPGRRQVHGARCSQHDTSPFLHPPVFVIATSRHLKITQATVNASVPRCMPFRVAWRPPLCVWRTRRAARPSATCGALDYARSAGGKKRQWQVLTTVQCRGYLCCHAWARQRDGAMNVAVRQCQRSSSAPGGHSLCGGLTL